MQGSSRRDRAGRMILAPIASNAPTVIRLRSQNATSAARASRRLDRWESGGSTAGCDRGPCPLLSLQLGVALVGHAACSPNVNGRSTGRLDGLRYRGPAAEI